MALFLIAFGDSAHAQRVAYSEQKSEFRSVRTLIPVSPADTNYVFSHVRNSVALAATNREQAVRLNNQAMEYSLKIGFADGIALTLMNAGFFEVEKGALENGIKYFLKAYPYCQQTRYYPHLLAKCYVNIGGLYFISGDYGKAAQANHYALRELEKLDSVRFAYIYVQVYNNAASVFLRIRQYEPAEKYIGLAEGISRKKNLKTEQAYMLCNKGEYQTVFHRYQEAERSFREGLNITAETGDRDIEQALYNGLGRVMLAQSKPREAIPYFFKALSQDPVINPINTAILPKYNLGLAYYQLKDYAKAEHYLTEAIREADGKHFIDEKINAHKMLADVYTASGQHQNALEQQRLNEAIKDSLFTENRMKDINELEIKYNTAQKDKEITAKKLLIIQQQVDLQRKNTWIWISSLGILLLASSAFWIYRNYRHKQSILWGKLNILEQAQEIRLLRASINGEEEERIRIGRELHDGIGGLLSAVKLQFGSLRLKNNEIGKQQDFVKAIALLDEATTEVRKTAHNLMPEVLLKGGIEEALKSFCERIRTEHGPQIQLQVYGVIPRLEATFELSIYRIIQELLNNTMKHSNATVTLVQLNWQDDLFHVSVEDNGKGMQQNKSEGIGLKNIKSRVEAMGGNLEIESAMGVGSTIYMDFDTNKLERAHKTI